MKKINFKKINSLLFSLIIVFSFLGFNFITFAQLDFTVTDQGDPNGDGNPGTSTNNNNSNNSTKTVVEPQGTYNDEPYQPLARLPGYPADGFDFSDKSCPLGQFMNTFIDIFIGIVAILSMVMIVMGGIEYVMSDLVTSKEEAKSRIQNAILGLILSLSIYIILNTLNPNLLNLCLDVKTQTITIGEDIPQKAVNGYYSNGKYKAGSKWDDSIGKAAVLPRGVTISNVECSTVGQQNCTSTRGLNTSIINSIANGCWEMNGKKDCNIVITGGTENWLHSANGSHRPDSATIDLRPTEDVNKYITGKTTPPNPNTTINKNGVNYYYHGNSVGGGYHWHIYQ